MELTLFRRNNLPQKKIYIKKKKRHEKTDIKNLPLLGRKEESQGNESPF